MMASQELMYDRMKKYICVYEKTLLTPVCEFLVLT